MIIIEFFEIKHTSTYKIQVINTSVGRKSERLTIDIDILLGRHDNRYFWYGLTPWKPIVNKDCELYLCEALVVLHVWNHSLSCDLCWCKLVQCLQNIKETKVKITKIITKLLHSSKIYQHNPLWQDGKQFVLPA